MSIERKTVAQRKALPIASGVLDYFPDALLAVAEVSRVGNEQHHPGEPLHWDKSKSTDEADALLRHLIDRGTRDEDGQRHSAKVAWRALALLQRELDAEGATTSMPPVTEEEFRKHFPFEPEPLTETDQCRWCGKPKAEHPGPEYAPGRPGCELDMQTMLYTPTEADMPPALGPDQCPECRFIEPEHDLLCSKFHAT